MWCAVCNSVIVGRPHINLTIPKRPGTPLKPAFIITSVHRFGRFMVKYGRSETKRVWLYINVFSHYSIHLLILKSFDTNSFIKGLNRLGENVLNFVEVNYELMNAFRPKWHQPGLNPDWCLLTAPPHASHMGWKRIIHTIRSV